jgi:hypothetical protein
MCKSHHDWPSIGKREINPYHSHMQLSMHIVSGVKAGCPNQARHYFQYHVLGNTYKITRRRVLSKDFIDSYLALEDV